MVLYIYVGPLESLYMTSDGGDQTSKMTSSLILPPVTSLTVRDSDTVSLRCVSRGGCPAPRLRMRIGHTDVTSSFRRSNHDVEVSGGRGLRRMTCGATLRTSSLVAKRQYDQLPVRCEAEPNVVGAVAANWTQLMLLIHCKYIQGRRQLKKIGVDTHDQHGAQPYNWGLEAEPPVESVDRARSQGVWEIP